MQLRKTRTIPPAKRIHVLIICLHADPAAPAGIESGGGTHQYLRELLVGLAGRGIRSSLVTRLSSPELPRREAVSRLATVFRAQIGRPEPIDKKLLDPLHPESLAVISRTVASTRLRPDLIHSVYWNSGRVAMDLSQKLHVPFVHTVISNGLRRIEEGFSEGSPTRIAIEHQVFAAAQRILCISGEERKDLITLYGVASSKITVVGRPVAACFVEPAHDEVGRARPVHLSTLLERELINGR